MSTKGAEGERAGEIAIFSAYDNYRRGHDGCTAKGAWENDRAESMRYRHVRAKTSPSGRSYKLRSTSGWLRTDSPSTETYWGAQREAHVSDQKVKGIQSEPRMIQELKKGGRKTRGRQ